MFIKRSVSKQYGKEYVSLVLTKSYRENGKIKHKSMINLSSWDKRDVEVFQKTLKGGSFTSLSDIETTAGKAIGALYVFKKISEETGIIDAIKKSSGKDFLSQVLLLIIGRILTQGSRRKLLEWSQTQEVEEILGIKPEKLTTDDLYETLDYLSDHQEEIELKLFNTRREQQKGESPRVYLYDVTSSYLEGEQNELAAYGYNRDKKKGKQQIVIGLMTDEKGYPFCIRVFEGNTQDPKTVHDQIAKLSTKFGVQEVVFVGDKGMIKTAQIKELDSLKFHYITSVTKPQIKKLISRDIFQLSLFDSEIGEVIDGEENIRYIYRRNPVRAEEMKKTRDEKLEKINRTIEKENEHLIKSPKAKIETGEKKLIELIKRFNVSYISINKNERVFSVTIDREKQKEEASFDGCFVIKTDLLDKKLEKQTIHDRYKDLKHVESAFRTIKTGFLEVRPIYVRKEKRTRGHIFATMLAYLLIHEFKERTQNITGTLEHKIDSLDKVQTIKLTFGKQTVRRIPEQPPFITQMLAALNHTLPSLL